MSETSEIRIDKFLWAVRIFKTRSQASDACRKGKILINNIQVKPSRVISAGEVILIKRNPAIFSYEVIKPVENRLSPKLVTLYINDITPENERSKLMNRELSGFVVRSRGTGRPTKRDRRNIDRLAEDIGFM
jgi:ribosome-associated heat shock protein Hsp15